MRHCSFAALSLTRDSLSRSPCTDRSMCWKSMTTFVSILDVVMFIITLIVGAAEFDGAFVKGNDMGGPSTVTLCHMGGKWEPSIQAGHVWRLFTAILLHAGFLHIGQFGMSSIGSDRVYSVSHAHLAHVDFTLYASVQRRICFFSFVSAM